MRKELSELSESSRRLASWDRFGFFFHPKASDVLKKMAVWEGELTELPWDTFTLTNLPFPEDVWGGRELTSRHVLPLGKGKLIYRFQKKGGPKVPKTTGRWACWMLHASSHSHGSLKTWLPGDVPLPWAMAARKGTQKNMSLFLRLQGASVANGRSEVKNGLQCRVWWAGSSCIFWTPKNFPWKREANTCVICIISIIIIYYYYYLCWSL